MLEEVREAIDVEMPVSTEWKEVDIHHILLRVVAMGSGRVFIGPELCRTKEYLESAISYTTEVMEAQRAVQQLHSWQKPFLASTLPQVKQLQERIKMAQRFIQPVLHQRQEAASDPFHEKPDDMLEWLRDNQAMFPDSNSQNLAKVQLLLSFAAIHTTTLTATNA
jgi:hypothetical protein